MTRQNADGALDTRPARHLPPLTSSPYHRIRRIGRRARSVELFPRSPWSSLSPVQLYASVAAVGFLLRRHFVSALMCVQKSDQPSRRTWWTCLSSWVLVFTCNSLDYGETCKSRCGMMKYKEGRHGSTCRCSDIPAVSEDGRGMGSKGPFLSVRSVTEGIRPLLWSEPRVGRGLAHCSVSSGNAAEPSCASSCDHVAARTPLISRRSRCMQE